MKFTKNQTGGIIEFDNMEIRLGINTRLNEELQIEGANTAELGLTIHVNSHAVLTINGESVVLRTIQDLKKYEHVMRAFALNNCDDYFERSLVIQEELGIFNSSVMDESRPSNEYQWNNLRGGSYIMYLIAPRLTDLKFLIDARNSLTEEKFEQIKQAKKSKTVWSILFKNSSKKTNALLRQFFRAVKYEDAEEAALFSIGYEFPAYIIELFHSQSKLQDALSYLLEKEPIASEFACSEAFAYHVFEYSNQKRYKEAEIRSVLKSYLGEKVAFDNKLIRSLKKACVESAEIYDNLDMGDCGVEESGYLNPLTLVHYKTSEVLRIHDAVIQELVDETSKLLYEQFLKRHRSKDLYELHDKLSYFHLSLVKNKDSKPFDYTPAQQSLEDNINGIQFVLPETNLDLVYIGETMNHCVATYEEAIREKTSTILSLFDEDECRHILCLEIDHNSHIVQAKKSHNGVLKKNNEADNRIIQILSTYVAKHKLIVDTMDLNLVLNQSYLQSIA